MEAAAFKSWLDSTEESFKSLDCDQKNTTLDRLISQCPGSQLYHLSLQLESLLKRDFLLLLPLELAQHLLLFLPAVDVLNCCSVSKSWNQVITGYADLWREACKNKGIADRCLAKKDAGCLKQLYLRSCRTRRAMRDNTAFRTQIFSGHERRITAVHYSLGKLATGSDDHMLRIWDCASGACLYALRTHSMTDIKFNKYFAVTGSHDRTAGYWDLLSGHKTVAYVGHVNALFSVDYNLDLDILVTAATDSTIRIWDLYTGAHLRTIAEHRCTWLIKVSIYHVPYRDHYHLVSRSSNSVHFTLVSSTHTTERCVTWHDADMDSLLPGLVVNANKVCYCIHDSKEGNVVRHNRDLERNQGVDVTKMSYDYLKSEPGDTLSYQFLGSGEKFDVIVDSSLRGSYSAVPSLDICDLSNNQVLASVPIHPDCKPGLRNATVTVGDVGWLDGFSEDAEEGLLFAAAIDNRILMIHWRHDHDDRVDEQKIV